MAKTIAQKALCLPVPAGHAILPVCSWRLFPRSFVPILHVCLEGKIIGDIKPRETRAPSPSPPVLHQEEKGLPATADCALLHPISLPPVQYTCSSSFEKTHKKEGPNFLLLTFTCPSYSMEHCVLWDTWWLDRSCPIFSIHQSWGCSIPLAHYILNMFFIPQGGKQGYLGHSRKNGLKELSGDRQYL